MASRVLADILADLATRMAGGVAEVWDYDWSNLICDSIEFNEVVSLRSDVA